MYNSSDASDLPKEKEKNFENNLVKIDPQISLTNYFKMKN